MFRKSGNRAGHATAVGLLTLLAGCVTPWNTQLPTVYSGHPYWENRRNERFDPFARGDLGPETHTRPREYMEPRTYSRRTRESSLNQAPPMPGLPNPMLAPTQGYPPQQFPGAVPF